MNSVAMTDLRFDETAADPPAPGDVAELRRWEEARRRRRLLDGTWGPDFCKRRKEHLGSEREDATGPTALVLNPLRNICSELSRLYDDTPDVSQPRLAAEDEAVLRMTYGAAGVLDNATDDAALQRAVIHQQLLADGKLRLEGFAANLAASNLWAQMPRFQEYVLACREYGLRVDVHEGVLSFREVYPDYVLAVPNPARPSEPIVLWELRLRRLEGGLLWTWDVFDLREPNAPRFAVHLAQSGGQLGDDLTDKFFPNQSFVGTNYPYKYSTGRPFIPIEIYHAQRLGDRLWDPYRWIELAESTLDLAVMYAFVVHVFRDASWPQRYAANVQIAGTGTNEKEGAVRQEISTDPAMVIMFEGISEAEGGGQPLIGQWSAGGDVAALDSVLGGMVQRAAQDVGVSIADVQRVSDASRSGVAISLTSEGKRAAQRRFRPHFKPSDETLLGKAAAMLNRATGSTLPETGWEVRHRELPLSPDEVRAKREDVLARLDRGLISLTDAYRELYGVSTSQAELALARIRAEQLQRATLLASASNPLNSIR